jgi:hypothetical protein
VADQIEAELTEILASEILDKIQKGEPVEYDHVRIKGDLDLSKLNLPTQHLERTELQKQMNLTEDVNVVQSSIDIINSTIQGMLNFGNSIFSGHVKLIGATFSQNSTFVGATFNQDASFDRAKFGGTDAEFRGATFCNDIWFSEATFSGVADFNGTTFSGHSWFDGATFNKFASFSRATFSMYAWFNRATFRGHTEFISTTFSKSAFFDEAKFEGDFLTFRDATFIFPRTQEEACRRAKNVLEKNGNREEAGYHFYREMDGKRKRKQWYIRYPEHVFIQLIFGYGVHPFRLMFCWFLVATIFAFFYSANGGIISKLPTSTLPQPLSYFVECFYFSIVTAVTPGYGKYELTSWEYQVIASIEAIFGTFMWAAFIATFARKYMR